MKQQKMQNKTNSKKYLEKNFPELLNYKRTASRRYEKGDQPGYRNTWWFKFMENDLDNNEFIIFTGALDNENKNFKILKVPAEFLKSNIDKMYKSSDGWTILYIHFNDLVDLRHPANLSFSEFAVN